MTRQVGTRRLRCGGPARAGESACRHARRKEMRRKEGCVATFGERANEGGREEGSEGVREKGRERDTHIAREESS